MKISKLYRELIAFTKNKDAETIFSNSGMLIKYQNCKLDYGFFPFGTGILIENMDRQEASIEEAGEMILGNDFGTNEYLKKCIENGNREKASNPTIRNLLSNLTGDIKNTFFTNFYLGVREKGTNTKRFQPLTNDYKEFCCDFFNIQLRLIKPKKVICLGHAVRLALAENTTFFPEWKAKGISLKKLYAENKTTIDIDIKLVGNVSFIVIPHPCDTRNFHGNYISI